MLQTLFPKHHHATVFVPPAMAAPVETLRRAWDPQTAAQIAAHVTVAYPDEAPDVDLLAARLRLASTTIRPFRLRLGGIEHFGRPDGGIYVEVLDVDGGYRRLRAEILSPPFKALDFPPHVTLVHPETSSRGPECWDELRDRDLDLTFPVDEVAITAFDGSRWGVLHRFFLQQAAEKTG